MKGTLHLSTLLLASTALVLIFVNCSGNPKPNAKKNISLQDSSYEVELQNSAALSGVKVDFKSSGFYTPSSPNPDTRCAGDVFAYYHPLASNSGEPVLLPQSISEPGYSQKPLFLKNVSVDLTDSSSQGPYNQSITCSFQSHSSTLLPSTCASFDQGSIGNSPNTIGGSLVILGGVQNFNFAATGSSFGLNCGKSTVGDTQCLNSMTALKINNLTNGLSSYFNWGDNYKSSLGRPLAGASVAYSPGTQSLYLFGGASLYSSPGKSTLQSVDGFQTWSFSLQEQKWIERNPIPFVLNTVLNMPDRSDPQGVTHHLKKSVGDRASFGYTSVPSMSLSAMSKNGTIDPSLIDTTDRIVTTAGLSTNAAHSRNSLKFNPTFGPEWVDLLGASGKDLETKQAVQWLDSYHTQLLNNLSTSSIYRGDLIDKKATLFSGFGFSSLRKSNAEGQVVAGLFVATGGFGQELENPSPPTRITESRFGGRMFYGGFKKKTGILGTPESSVSNFNRTPDYPFRLLSETSLMSSTRITEMAWVKLVDADLADAPNSIPNFTGVNLLPGFNLKTNDLVYFGGTTCPDYLTNKNLLNDSNPCLFNNPGRYWKLSPSVNLESTSENLPNHLFSDWNNTTPPTRAGMASARGEDASGKIILVSWGGMNKPVTSDDINIGKISVLYNAALAGAPDDLAPKWGLFEPISSVRPDPSTNSSLVYSHVTRKFYLFAGSKTTSILGQLSTHNETWELSVSGSCPTCQFSWKKLSTATGTTCYPECPPARRSHRMTEANYHYSWNPQTQSGTYHSSTLEPRCTDPKNPCSFGIFMEGGLSDPSTILDDRWMFDPTANTGNGHWQRVDGFAPRHFASMAAIDFSLNINNSTPRWLLLYGGETGLQNPQLSHPTQYFVPPTLGDTYLYDTSTNTWNRAELLGRGYKNDLPDTLLKSEKTQAFIVKEDGFYQKFTTQNNATVLQLAPEISELSPPPVSGGILVTRTHFKNSNDANSESVPLPVQETFLLGGRLKSGKFMALNHVYKFCPGSGGEKLPTPASAAVEDPQDFANCDPLDYTYFVSSNNSFETYPGRWLRKNPSDSENLKSFLGAGAYDSHHDKIILFGGLGGETTKTSITETGLEVGNKIYEYTPPSKIFTPDSQNSFKRHGSWNEIPACTGVPNAKTPGGRFGHNLGYDPLRRELIITGGLDKNRNPLTQTMTLANGQTISAPEIWTAKRVDQPGSVSNPSVMIPPSSPFPCYFFSQKTSFGTLSEYEFLPPQGGLAHAASAFIPAGGYNSGYYSFFDHACAKSDSSVNATPGVYFDIDRQFLEKNEDLILNMTFIPMSTAQIKPDGSHYQDFENTVFKIHLIRSGKTALEIRQTSQPRFVTFEVDDYFPKLIHTLSIIAPVSGGMRQEQIYLPLSLNSGIDLIRIERSNGSAILIDASLYRMGKL